MTTLIILLCTVTLSVLYYLIRYYRIKGLYRKLRDADIKAFIREPGKKYRTRPLNQNRVRYKWIKPLYTIRTDFDRSGKQAKNISITKRRLFRRERRLSMQRFGVKFDSQLENEEKIH